ncbi:hypothetical protein PTKIN_Ptkin13bG0102100 [Pterospermum kingtungense]
MKLGSRNVRGLGRSENNRVVKKLIVNKKFNLFFIQETKIKEDEPRLHRRIWGNVPISWEFVTSDGNSGGLISYWRDEFFHVDFKHVSSRFILLIGTIKRTNFKRGFGNVYAPNDDSDRVAFLDERTNFKCGFANVYAPNDDSDRASFWDELVSIINNIEVPWCLIRDFNVVRSPKEKVGLTVNNAAMSFFLVFETLGLID